MTKTDPFGVPVSSPLAEDVVLRYLVTVNLTESESQFRSIIRHVSKDASAPTFRDLVIATVGTLISMGGLEWPVIFETVSALAKLDDGKLAESAVAIANGQYLLLPTNGPGIVSIDLSTMRETHVKIRAMVSTVYSCSAIWSEVERALSSEG